MLNDSQKLTIKVAVRRARENGAEATEIKKLAAGMEVGEDEIRAYADQVLGVSVEPPVTPEAPPSAPVVKLPKKPAGKYRRTRLVWTNEMLHQLQVLRDSGESICRIAEMMGIDVDQVKNKLRQMPVVSRKTQKAPSAPAVEQELAPKAATEAPKEVDASVQPTAPVPLSAAPVEEGEAEADSPDYPIDMPAALLQLMKLVRDNYGEDVARVYASNDEHRAACAFQVDGTYYDLTLEVLE